MSLSLLNEYGSSDESGDEETEVNSENPGISISDDSIKQSKSGEVSKEGKNFFEADLSDSNDDDEAVVDPHHEETTASDLIGPSAIPHAYVDPNSPLYGPAHPSQMYNYAAFAYADNYAEASPSNEYQEQPDEGEPSAKRRRAGFTDEDAKKLIKKYEADSLGLEMPDDLEIIDAHVDSHLGSVKETLVKNITTVPTAEAAAAALAALQGNDPNALSKDGKKPGGLAKRKHQITYLAYLAKANEEKLQNEWAKNRLTKRQTQAKYGF